MFSSYFTNDSYWFRRPFLERDGYAYREAEGKLIIKVNVLGLSKDDIDLSVKPSTKDNHQILVISGSKEDENFGKFQVSHKFLIKNPKSIEPSIENGILTLVVEYKEPVVPDVEIKGWLKE